MLQVKELTYAAIITITLPEVSEKATVTVTLTPRDNIQTGSGEIKALRDCTLQDLREFAEALESDIWQDYQSLKLSELAADEQAHVKITILNDTGEPLSTTPEEWLSHVVITSLIQDSENEVGEAARTPSPAATLPAGPLTKPDDTATPALEQPVTGPAEAVPDSLEAAPEAIEPEPVEVTVSDAETAESEEAPVPDSADTAAVPTTPRVAKMRIAGMRRPPGHSTRAAVDILVNEPAFRDAQAHSLTSLDREVAGMLIGPRPEKQPDGRYVVHITDIIIAKHTRMHGASVTYTPESWRYIHDKLAERYPNEEAVIVGWYHTHPGFGIFLSGMDLFIHQNFFTQIWHIAYVLDPVARRSGFFCWNRSKASVEKYEFPWPKWAAGSW